MTATERLLAALEARSAHAPRKTGAGRWQARCPAHDDRNPSLSITAKGNGDVLIHCHAGCDVEDVVAAVGLTLADLFEERSDGRQVVATYRYVDESGVPLFEVVRYRPKDFRQRRPDGIGGWIWKLDGTRRVLYQAAASARSHRAR